MARKISQLTASSGSRLKYKRSFENESNTASAKNRGCCKKESVSSEVVKGSKRLLKGPYRLLPSTSVDVDWSRFLIGEMGRVRRYLPIANGGLTALPLFRRRRFSLSQVAAAPLITASGIAADFRAGLRANEIAMARWSMVTDAEGKLGDALHLPNKASKGKNGGRTVPLRAELRDALRKLYIQRNPDPNDHIVDSERDAGMSAGAVQRWFHRLYQELGFSGASSHSGRRTFRIAKKIIEAGGSLRRRVSRRPHR
jgi:integrase